MLRIALPNKGALSEDAVTLVREAGYKVRRAEGDLIARDPANEVEFFFLRPRDIAVYVSDGTLEIGITGRDLARDSPVDVAELLALGFGRSSFFYAVPKERDVLPNDFGGYRIATSYPHIVARDLEARGVEATVVELDGAVEISVRLGVADAVADVVQTGRTLDQNGLKTVGTPVLESEAILIGRDGGLVERLEVRTFVERGRGIILARTYVMVEYDVQEHHLDAACAVTPGIESPTIAPLSKPGWVAVKAMAERADVHTLVDRLAALGARGIIVTEIKTCRI